MIISIGSPKVRSPKISTDRIIRRVCFGLLAAFVLNAARHAVAGGPEEASYVTYGSCASGALRIELNKNDESGKMDLLQAYKSIAAFPELQFIPVRADSPEEAVINVAAIHVCANDQSTCAESMGWLALQRKLDGLSGVGVSCASDEPSGTR